MVILLCVPEYATVELSSEDQGVAVAKFPSRLGIVRQLENTSCCVHRTQRNAAVELTSKRKRCLQFSIHPGLIRRISYSMYRTRWSTMTVKPTTGDE